MDALQSGWFYYTYTCSLLEIIQWMHSEKADNQIPNASFPQFSGYSTSAREGSVLQLCAVADSFSKRAHSSCCRNCWQPLGIVGAGAPVAVCMSWW